MDRRPTGPRRGRVTTPPPAPAARARRGGPLSHQNGAPTTGPSLFAGPGRTATLPCWPRGTLEVAAGHGQGAVGRAYDWDRINHARDQAFAILAKTLAGHPVDADDPAAGARHREVIDRWSAESGRTSADASRAYRTAAARAEHAWF